MIRQARHLLTLIGTTILFSVASSIAQANEEMVCVQNGLNSLGYLVGSADGVIGPKTRRRAAEINIDFKFGLEPLNTSRAAQWCAKLNEYVLGAELHAGDRMAARPNNDDAVCVENPPVGYSRTIAGIVSGDPVYLRVSTQFAGAVDSLVWRGKQFINIYDHGRQISYAWQMDKHGECLNPTEPGSASDLFEPRSTSILKNLCQPEPNKLSTSTQAAYWTAPGETGFCDSGTKQAVNKKALSDHTLNKEITIGYQGIENAILFDATLKLPRDHSWLGLEFPTAYLTSEFNTFWRYDPQRKALERSQSEPAQAPWSFSNTGGFPPIIATEDGQYALGAYTDHPIIAYEQHRYEVTNPNDTTSKWNIVLHETPAPAGDYRYETFAIIGTLEDVTRAMDALYKINPFDTQPPVGYVDRADCNVIAGWAWDPDLPSKSIDVAFYDINEDGKRTFMRNRKARTYRSDLATALGDDGVHGFQISSPKILEGKSKRKIAIEAIHPDTGKTYPLIPSLVTLNCPQP
ncbi:MAG: peptidoglycan-binding domain-containing protein [Pseudomonadota bacterium]